MNLTHLFRCLHDPTRLRIFHLLTHSPLCVSHLQEVLELPQAKVSQHLATLRRRKLAQGKRLGTWMVYSVSESRSEPFDAVVGCVRTFARADMQCFVDFKRLEKLKASAKWKRGVLRNGNSPQSR